MEGAAGGRKEKWEEELEDAVESEDEDLDLSEYYFLKTGVRVFCTGRIFTAFGNELDLEVDLGKEELMAIRLPCSHLVLRPRVRGRGCFRESEMEAFAKLYCNMPIVKEYPSCGHKIALTCTQFRSLGGEQVLKICPFRCEKETKICYDFHPCGKRCGEDCNPCMSTVSERLSSCPKKHYNDMWCFVRRDEDAKMELKCVKEVMPRRARPTCGHILTVKCYEADTLTAEELDRRCNERCEAVLKECGHKCSGSCAECFAFRLHKKCGQKCEKILICDHKCLKTCGEACGPCGRSCWRMCPHKKCQLECGVPCNWECDEPCDYGCKHGQCSLKCGEPCNKAPCQRPCPLKIPDCGHDCVGFCGEKCPPFCRYCTPEKLADGALLGELEGGDRFIYLEGCGHCVESSAMDQWMNVKDEEGLIILKRCPICRSRLSWMCRYSKVLKVNWDAIESVKKRIFGDEGKIEELLEQLEKKLSEASTQESVFYPQFLSSICAKIDRDKDIGCRRADLNWNAVRWMEWIFDEWVRASSHAVQCKGMKKISRSLEGVRGRWRNLFWVVSKRQWPLEQCEMLAFFREKQRLEDFTKVCRVVKEAQSKDKGVFSMNFFGRVGRPNFGRVMQILEDGKSYNPTCQDEFEEAFRKFSGQMRVTLAISEQERLSIVEAFGGQGTGRWFKCPNGHVYVITECAGAITVGQCPECRERIGGLQHRVWEDNYLAVEMDGADEPAYDRTLRVDQQGIRDAMRRDAEAVQLAMRRNRAEALALAVRVAREDARRRVRGAILAGGRGRGRDGN